MNVTTLSRLLGWFSLGLGAIEVAAPAALRRHLGLPSGPWLVRAFGFREIAAGVAVLAKPESAFGPGARVAGDFMDIAALANALAPSNPRRGTASVALALVLGITALDILCTSALLGNEGRRLRTSQRARAALIDSVRRA